MRVSPNRFCLSAPWPAVTKKRLENTLFSKRTGHFSCSACGLSPEVQPSWRLARVLALLLGFGKVCGFTGRADGPPGTEQVDLHPGDWSFPVAPCIQEVRASNPLREQGEERRREAARSAGRCEGERRRWDSLVERSRDWRVERRGEEISRRSSRPTRVRCRRDQISAALRRVARRRVGRILVEERHARWARCVARSAVERGDEGMEGASRRWVESNGDW